MENVKLDNLTNLHLLWVVIGLAGLTAYGFAMKNRALRTFASANLLGTLVPNVSRRRQVIRAVLALASMIFLVIALLGPRWGVFWEEVHRKGIDLMICVDVSRSMLARDLAPNRLERAKQDIRDLVAALPGDRVGLLTFAGLPILKCPLTIDYGFFRLVLDDVDVNSAPRGGTNLGDAIRMAAESFDDRIKNSKAIVLISDGEDQDTYPVDAAAKVYRERGIRVYTIGLGDATQGARIPVGKGGQENYLVHDGQQIWSKMNPQTLQEIALAGGGAYVPAGTQNIELDRIYKEKIATIEQREFEARKVQRHHARFQIFAAIALGLLLIESLTNEVRTRRPASVEAAA
ncbi:MAG: VWA domain-containing protein [Phycisphaerae bacterium]|nr:VWA domain-containing protein [Phycisphaerae bacterium]